MALATYASSDHKHEATNGGLAVDIDNFGKINDHYYRGAQPKSRNYEQLAAIGVKTIVDLRDDAKGSSRSDAERAGLHYITLPLKDKQSPQADAVARFLVLDINSA